MSNSMVPSETVDHTPVGHLVHQQSQETASSAVAANAKALVEARYTVAIRRPRDLDLVRQKMLKECGRSSFAAVARYRKPVGAGIEGPSIRFAEMAIRCMGNVTVETATVYDDREKRIVRVAVTDLEANVPYSIDVTIDKTVERRSVKAGDEVVRSRLNSKGDTVHLIAATEDEILNKQNALISKAIRTQGLRLVPGDIVDECMTEVKAVLAKGDWSDPDAAKKKLFDAFELDCGVTVDQLKEYLGHQAASLTPKELSDLRGLYAALKDGETSWREIMDARGGETTAKPKAPSKASERLAAVTAAPAVVEAKPADAPEAAGVTEEVREAKAAAASDYVATPPNPPRNKRGNDGLTDAERAKLDAIAGPGEVVDTRTGEVTQRGTDEGGQ